MDLCITKARVRAARLARWPVSSIVVALCLCDAGLAQPNTAATNSTRAVAQTQPRKLRASRRGAVLVFACDDRAIGLCMGKTAAKSGEASILPRTGRGVQTSMVTPMLPPFVAGACTI